MNTVLFLLKLLHLSIKSKIKLLSHFTIFSVAKVGGRSSFGEFLLGKRNLSDLAIGFKIIIEHSLEHVKFAND